MPSKVPTIGLIAGWGSFPVEVAQRILESGQQLRVVGLKGHADERLLRLATDFRWMGVLKIGGHIRYLARAGVDQVVWAGKIFKNRVLYEGRGWIEHLPDITCYRVLGGSFITRKNDGRDDTVLTAVANEYERRGMSILPITEVAPKLLIEDGLLNSVKPRRKSLLDAEFGWQIARQMGQLDIGQSITVKDQIVLGVEAIEGTDSLIQRTGQLCPRGGFTLIKVAKPNQDMRFDVPTIGKRSVEQMIRAGGKTIVVEAGRTILVEREETLRLADQAGISIVSMEDAVSMQDTASDEAGASIPGSSRSVETNWPQSLAITRADSRKAA